MTEIQRYLAEEVAEDHADGIITRREAMRRLGLLGLGSAAASALLAVPAAEASARLARPGPGRGTAAR
jgi:carboxymethylenebutenolidase